MWIENSHDISKKVCKKGGSFIFCDFSFSQAMWNLSLAKISNPVEIYWIFKMVVVTNL